MMLPRWIRRLLGRRHLPSPLKVELANLKKNYDRDDDYLADTAANFWRNGGVCCPSCGVPGYSALVEKQERRLKRMEGIKKKLECS